MSCVITKAFDVSMATTQFTRAVHYEVRWPSVEAQGSEGMFPRMNWVVVTDEHGKRQLRMQWTQS